MRRIYMLGLIAAMATATTASLTRAEIDIAPGQTITHKGQSETAGSDATQIAALRIRIRAHVRSLVKARMAGLLPLSEGPGAMRREHAKRRLLTQLIAREHAKLGALEAEAAERERQAEAMAEEIEREAQLGSQLLSGSSHNAQVLNSFSAPTIDHPIENFSDIEERAGDIRRYFAPAGSAVVAKMAGGDRGARND